jgi:hypothetical protein
MVIKSSDLQGASALIFTGACHLIGVSFTGDTLKFPTLTVYDGITAAGTKLIFLRTVSSITDVANPTINLMFPGKGVPCSTGIYAALSTAEGDYIIYYSL